MKIRNKFWGISTLKSQVEKAEVERRLTSTSQRVWSESAIANANGTEFWKMVKTFETPSKEQVLRELKKHSRKISITISKEWWGWVEAKYE